MAEEKLFENKIKKFLKDRGAWCLKYWAGASYTKAGVPDILVCLKGLFIAIEVKASNGKPSELQIHTLKEIKQAGGIGFVLYPKDWGEFQEFIKMIEGLETIRDKDMKILKNWYPFLTSWEK